MSRDALAALAALAVALAAPAAAQDAPARIPSHCLAFADAARVVPAAVDAPLEADTIRIRYLGHASVALETPGGLLAVTDYTGYTGAAGVVPDVVTMNNAHPTHWTDRPDPRIPHVLRGWAEDGVAAAHELDLGEMLVRNVPTDLRAGLGGVRRDGNSIFVFEAAGLCIGHLGHLQQEPGPEEYAMLGRLDVVMVPVDGGYTMDIGTMSRVVQRLRSSVVIPIHWFSEESLERFLAQVEGDFDVVRMEQPDLVLSLDRLPGRPTVMVLPPQWID